MKNYQILVLAASLILFSNYASSQGFGTYQPDEEKKIDDLEAEFQLGVVNLYDDSRRVILDAEETEAYEVVFNENPVVVNASEVESIPGEGGDWISLGGGRYGKIRMIDFRVVLNESADRRRFSIPVTVATGYERSSNSSGPVQSAYQVREHVFELETTSQLIMPGADDIYRGEELWSSNRSSEEGENMSEGTSSGEERAENGTDIRETPEKGLTRQEENDVEGVNRWTLILLAGTVISIMYLFRQI